jgi:hypothetical protein
LLAKRDEILQAVVVVLRLAPQLAFEIGVALFETAARPAPGAPAPITRYVIYRACPPTSPGRRSAASPDRSLERRPASRVSGRDRPRRHRRCLTTLPAAASPGAIRPLHLDLRYSAARLGRPGRTEAAWGSSPWPGGELGPPAAQSSGCRPQFKPTSQGTAGCYKVLTRQSFTITDRLTPALLTAPLARPPAKFS